MIELRAMTKDDPAAVSKIEERISLEPWPEKLFWDCIDVGYKGWVFEESGLVVGFALISISSEEAHVLNLGVQPEYQGQGLGKRMMCHLIDVSKVFGARIMILEVRRSNHIAIGLYKKLNFKEIGLRENYYPTEDGREDAIVLELRL